MQTERTETTRQSDIEGVTTAFARVGAVWARYGLGVAQLSVETSARALDATAHALGVLRDRFEMLADAESDEDPRDVIDASAESER